jgi:hypothetical protein
MTGSAVVLNSDLDAMEVNSCLKELYVILGANNSSCPNKHKFKTTGHL